jgi:predicted nucleic acid-binding protein
MTRYVIDTSAWFAAQRDPDRWAWLTSRVVQGDVAVPAPTRFEILHTARSPKEFDELRYELELIEDAPLESTDWSSVFDVYAALAAKGGHRHRQLGMADALVAASAARAERTLLHYDQHFDTIAALTGQPTEWIAPRGSL